jgi:hypothetical protein
MICLRNIIVHTLHEGDIYEIMRIIIIIIIIIIENEV